jgi:glucan biosynthesis protein C
MAVSSLNSTPIAEEAHHLSRGDSPVAKSSGRFLFIDNIRWTMVILVLTMHASDTYSPFGNWYYTDRGNSNLATIATFAIYQSFLQAFFMGLLFFVSGYFTVQAWERKEAMSFVRDRFRRLGIPTLLYMLVIGPFTQYFLSHTWGSGGFGHQWLTHLLDGEWLSETGPMWFCAALLVFSLAFVLIQKAWPKPRLPNQGRPNNVIVSAFLIVMSILTFLARIVVPENISVLNMHLGDFPQYVLMFGAGTVAYRGAWLQRFPKRSAVRWAVGALLSSIPLLIILIVARASSHFDRQTYNGGFNLISAIKCSWEAFVCIGMSFGLIVLYKHYFDHQSALAKYLSHNAFAVYLFHPPIIIAAAIALHSFNAPGLVKAALLLNRYGF